MAFSGKLSFNPMTDSLTGADGKPFRFEAPGADELPTRGFTPGDTSFLPVDQPQPNPEVEINIAGDSGRLEKLQPFEPHFTKEQIDNGEPLEFRDVRCLFRVRGKCTTDEVRI